MFVLPELAEGANVLQLLRTLQALRLSSSDRCAHRCRAKLVPRVCRHVPARVSGGAAGGRVVGKGG